MTAKLPAFAAERDITTLVASYEALPGQPLTVSIFDETGWEELGGFDWGGSNDAAAFDGAPNEPETEDALRSLGFSFVERNEYCTDERDGFTSWITVWSRDAA